MRTASALALSHGVRGATDITGYGLLGHGMEMAEASGVRLVLHARAIPFLSGARAYVLAGCIPGGSADNQIYFGPRVRFDPSIDEYSRSLLFDAQTSGGLLISLPAASQPAFLEAAAERALPVWVVGSVEPGEGIEVRDTGSPSPPAGVEGYVFLIGD